MANKTSRAEDYDVGSIRVLKGLEPVEAAPGMSPSRTNPLHIIQEVVDNATDEVLAGFCSRIAVTVRADGGITVEDNGRGIPIGMHPEEKAPVVEFRLYASARGREVREDGRCGPLLVRRRSPWRGRLGHERALDPFGSHRLARRPGGEPRFRGRERRRAAHPEEEPAPKSQTGTRVTAWPDGNFDSPTIPAAELVRLLRSKAVLLPGCEVVTRTSARARSLSGSMRAGSRSTSKANFAANPSWSPSKRRATPTPRRKASPWAKAPAGWSWTTEGPLTRESYVNLIPTPQGGTHESGLKDGLFQAIRAFMEVHGLQTKRA